MKPYLLHPNEPINKKLTEYPAFERRIKEHLETVLRIEFDHELFTSGRSMGDFMSSLAECRKRLVIPE